MIYIREYNNQHKASPSSVKFEKYLILNTIYLLKMEDIQTKMFKINFMNIWIISWDM